MENEPSAGPSRASSSDGRTGGPWVRWVVIGCISLLAIGVCAITTLGSKVDATFSTVNDNLGGFDAPSVPDPDDLSDEN